MTARRWRAGAAWALALAALLAPTRPGAHPGVEPDDPGLHRTLYVEAEGVATVGSGTQLSSGGGEGYEWAHAGCGGRVFVTRPLGAGVSAQERLAGYVDASDGSLTLEELATTGYQARWRARLGQPFPQQIWARLWIDTGGDGRFFTFDPAGQRVGLDGDSYGWLDATITVNEVPHGTLAIDGATPYRALAGPADAATLADLRTTLPPSTKVAVWFGAWQPGGSDGEVHVDPYRMGLVGDVHNPCIDPIGITARMGSVAPGQPVDVAIWGVITPGEHLPDHADRMIVKVTKPGGLTTWLEGGPCPSSGCAARSCATFCYAQLPGSHTTAAGDYLFEAWTVEQASNYLNGYAKVLLRIPPPPATYIGPIAFTPSSGKIAPTRRIDMRVFVGLGPSVPAEKNLVTWTIVDPAMRITTIRSSSRADGTADAWMGSSSASVGALGAMLQTAIPGTYHVEARLDALRYSSASFQVG